MMMVLLLFALLLNMLLLRLMMRWRSLLALKLLLPRSLLLLLLELMLSVDLSLRMLSDRFRHRHLLFSVTLHGAVVIEAKGNTLLLVGLRLLNRLVGGRQEVKTT